MFVKHETMVKIFSSSFMFVFLTSINKHCVEGSMGDGRVPDSRIVWVDMEMSGLDPDNCKVLEVACVITDCNLTVVARAPHLIIHQNKQVLDNMNSWCLEQHNKSGLIAECLKSSTSEQEADKVLLDFLQDHKVPKYGCSLAGNTVYMDRLFMRKYLPKFENYLHYRIIDVSSIKELCKRWFPKEYENSPDKNKDLCNHRALADINTSIEELKYYKEHIFRKHGEHVGDAMGIQWC